MYHGLLRLAVLAEAEGEVADGLRARLDRHGLIEREGVVLVVVRMIGVCVETSQQRQRTKCGCGCAVHVCEGAHACVKRQGSVCALQAGEPVLQLGRSR
jgi:hypothetical protein